MRIRTLALVPLLGIAGAGANEVVDEVARRLDRDDDFLVLASGERRPVTRDWHGDLPDPEWLYFGDAKRPRVLYLLNHRGDSEVDQFWQMEGAMTVFGFGREYRCCGRYLTAPGRFTIGLAETTDHAAVAREVQAHLEPWSVRVGQPTLSEEEFSDEM